MSDLSGLVSIQGCVSRSVRDTAAFVDNCRGGAPGEFMPFWSPAEPYSDLIQRDPGRLRIALSHEWGDYQSPPHFVAELERGRLRAALDVTDPEPLPGDHPLWSLPGALIVPHVGGNTSAMLPRTVRLIRAQIERMLAGEPPLNVVYES